MRALILLALISWNVLASDLLLDTPIPVSVEVIVNYEVENFEVDIPAKRLVATYVGHSAAGAVLSSGSYTLSPEQYDMVMSAPATDTLEKSLKDMLYACLKDKLNIAGTME